VHGRPKPRPPPDSLPAIAAIVSSPSRGARTTFTPSTSASSAAAGTRCRDLQRPQARRPPTGSGRVGGTGLPRGPRGPSTPASRPKTSTVAGRPAQWRDGHVATATSPRSSPTASSAALPARLWSDSHSRSGPRPERRCRGRRRAWAIDVV
jgi:hypothetical protein